MRATQIRSLHRLFLVSALCIIGLMLLQACNNSNNNHGSCVYTLSNPEPSPDSPETPNNAVLAFRRDESDGTIEMVDSFLTGGFGFSFTGGTNQNSLVSRGRNLYVVNPGAQPGFAGTANEGQGSITAFKIQNDCSLERNGDVVPSGGTLPGSLAIHNDLLYVANEGNFPGDDAANRAQGSYSGFRINGDGTLTPIPGSTVVLEQEADNPVEDTFGNTPVDIAFNADGSRLIGTRLTGNGIDSFGVDANGLLTDRQTLAAGGGPFGFSFSPTDPSLLLVTLAEPMFNDPMVPALDRAPGLGAYLLSDNGGLAFSNAFTDENDPNLVDPCWTAVTEDGQFIWTSSFIPRSINLFSVAADGTIRHISAFNSQDTDPDTGKIIGGLDIALSSDGAFLYQLRAFDVDFLLDEENAEFVVPQIDVLRVTDTPDVNGGLERIQTLRLPEDQNDAGSMGLLIVDLN